MFSQNTCDDPVVWASDTVAGLTLQENLGGLSQIFSGLSNPDGSMPVLDLVETMCPEAIEEKVRLALVAAVNAVFEGECLAHQAWADQPEHQDWEEAARTLGGRVGATWQVDSQMSWPPAGETIRKQAEQDGLLAEVPVALADVWVQVAQREALMVWDARCHNTVEQPTTKEDFE